MRYEEECFECSSLNVVIKDGELTCNNCNGVYVYEN